MPHSNWIPPEGERIRETVRERLAQADADDGEKITIEWRGSRTFLRVISMPADILYYNPDTHRIRAQRSLDPVQDRKLEQDPWGAEGQSYLEYLLKTQPSSPGQLDPEFQALRDSLEDFGQQDPGLITPYGVLVNGNTRCAALRELGERYIRVGVLPGDTTSDDISAVELALQLRRENKRDYSYINQLIAIDEQAARGRRPEEIAREFHIQSKTLEMDRWVFAQIRSAIDRSDDGEGNRLRLVDFEDHQEKLRELFRAYTQQAATNRDAAEALLESRLALIVLGFSKTDTRLARSEFHTKYLRPKLPNSAMPTLQEGPATIAIPGLGAAVTGDTATVKQAKALTDRVLKARASTRGESTATTATQRGAESILKEVKESVNSALRLAGQDDRLRQRKLAAPERITDASDALELAAGDVAQALATKSVDVAALDEALSSLRASILKLARQVGRAVDEPGEGAAWLARVAGDAV